jgi:hypothetical protein
MKWGNCPASGYTLNIPKGESNFLGVLHNLTKYPDVLIINQERQDPVPGCCVNSPMPTYRFNDVPYKLHCYIGQKDDLFWSHVKNGTSWPRRDEAFLFVYTKDRGV